MNKVLMIGNLTKDPEVGQTTSGVTACRFSIGVSRDYANADGTRETDFFNVTVWRNKAENCGKYLKKGNKVAVSGSLQNRTYEGKDGVKRNVTEIIATDVEFLTPRPIIGEEQEVVRATHERKLDPIEDNQLPF